MTDRIHIKERIAKMVDHGFSTHRSSNKILLETSFEIVDAILDELEANKKPIKEKSA